MGEWREERIPLRVSVVRRTLIGLLLGLVVRYSSTGRRGDDLNLRAVAQLGSALDWGSRGRGFKSRQPDQRAARVVLAVFACPHRMKAEWGTSVPHGCCLSGL